MKRVFSLMIAVAAIAMVSCAGTPKSDKGEAAETKATTEGCCTETKAEECGEKPAGACGEAEKSECESACESTCEAAAACSEE